MNPKRKVQLAWVLLVGSMIGWPLSAFTLAKDEPPFILGLSWFAITLTALDVLFTADVRSEIDDEHGEIQEDVAELGDKCQVCGK